MDDSRKDVHPQKDRRVVTTKFIMLTSRNIEILPWNDPYRRTPNPYRAATDMLRYYNLKGRERYLELATYETKI